MTDQASQPASASPVRAAVGGVRWKVGLVVAGAIAVIGVGLLGPRATPAPRTGSDPAGGARPAVSGVSVSQVGSDVTVVGTAADEVGTLVVSLDVGSTVLAVAQVTPRDGRFSATLRPRVPPGGLIARYRVGTAGGAVAAETVEGPIVLEATTAFRRTVDPSTGRTWLAGSTP